MPRVETVVPPEGAPPPQTPPQKLQDEWDKMGPDKPVSVMLRPGEIAVDQLAESARPGPQPSNEAAQIVALAASLTSIGQIVPCVVERKGSLFALVDGRRRRAAAALLDSNEHPFYLSCVVRQSGVDSLRVAITANLQRQGYNALQFAYLCQSVRTAHNWTGTKEVAEYLGVSRAQVGKHDKLLHKPAGMDEETYRSLIADIASGSVKADTALWCLTHVKDPTDIPIVLALAQDIATEEQQILEPVGDVGSANALEAPGPIQGSPSTANGAQASPASQESQESGSQSTAKAKKKAKKAKKVAKAKAKPVKAAPRHAKQAARKLGAVKTGKEASKPRGHAAQVTPLQRSLPELRKLFETMKGSVYPDVMRNFVSVLADSWWRGDATDKEVITNWNHIAAAVELGEKVDAARVKKVASAKVKKSRDKKKSKNGKNGKKTLVN